MIGELGCQGCSLTFQGVSASLIDSARHRRNQAITACCLAAAAAGDNALSGDRCGKLLMNCLGALTAVYRVGQAPSLAEFRRGLARPLRELLPPDVAADGVGDHVLLDPNGHLSDEARDLCVEHFVPTAALEAHWSWARVSAEQEERRIYQQLRRLRAADYTRARELFVDRPAGELRDLRRAWDQLWGKFDHYEPISDWTWCQARGWWFGCPVCHWPMRVKESGQILLVHCEAHLHDGISYTCQPDGPADRPPRLQPAGANADIVDAVPATRDHLAVTRTAWRYVTLPGVLECNLRDYARAAGASVDMWPHKDRYDLKIALGREIWRVDAKAWASPVGLGEALLEAEPPALPLIIVIPDHQKSSREMLHHMIGGRGYTVLTAAGLKAQIDQAKEAAR